LEILSDQQKQSETGLPNGKPSPKHHKESFKISLKIIESILYLLSTYHFDILSEWSMTQKNVNVARNERLIENEIIG
jgi:hypothetical protein